MRITTLVSVSKTPAATFIKERHAAGAYHFTTERLETTDCPLYRKRLVQEAKDLAGCGSCALGITFEDGAYRRSWGSRVRYNATLDRIEAAADVTFDSAGREVIDWQPVAEFCNHYTREPLTASTTRK